MHYELAHDSIAIQVFQKASTEARTRRKVERFIQERHLAYTERGAKLTQDDLDFISPYLGVVNISTKEEQFIRDAKSGLRRERQRRRLLVAGVIISLSILAGLALVLWRTADQQRVEAQKAKYLAETQGKKVESQKREIEGQRDNLVNKEKELRIALSEAKKATKTAQQKAIEATRAKLDAQQQKQNAEISLRLAEKRRIEADSAKSRALENRTIAEKNAELAAQNEEKAYQSAEEARILAEASQLCAIAIAKSSEDRTLALHSAFEACELSNYRNELALATLMRFTNDNSHAYYLDSYKDAAADTVNQSLGLSADGQLVAVGQEDGTVLVLRASDRSLQQRLQQNGHTMTVRSLRFSRNNKLLLTAADDEKVCLWNTDDGSLINTFSFPETQIKVALFAPDEQSIYVAGQSGNAWRRTLSNQVLKCSIRHSKTIWDMAFSPNGLYLATLGYDGYVKLWDANGEKLIRSARIKDGLLKKLAFSPNGRYLATADITGATIIWHANSLKEYRKLAGSSNVRSLVFSTNGRWLAQTSTDEQLTVIDWQHDSPAVQLIGHEGQVNDLDFSPDGTKIWSTGADGTTKVWDWRYRQTVQTLDEKIDGGTFGLAYSSDGQWIASGGQDRRIRLWRNDGQAQAPSWASPQQEEQIRAVGFCQQNQQIWSVDATGQAVVWRMEDGTMVSKSTITTGDISAMTSSSDGRWYAVATANDPPSISVWDMENQQKSQTFSVSASTLISFCFSQDGNWLIIGSSKGEVLIYDLAAQQMLLSLQTGTERITALAFHPELNLLAVGGEKTPFRLFQLKMKAGEWSFLSSTTDPAINAVTALAFSKDGKWLFIGDNQKVEKTAYIWSNDQQQLVQITPLTNDYGFPYRALFHPQNSREVATACLDGKIRIIKNMPYMLQQSQRLAFDQEDDEE